MVIGGFTYPLYYTVIHYVLPSMRTRVCGYVRARVFLFVILFKMRIVHNQHYYYYYFELLAKKIKQLIPLSFGRKLILDYEEI